VPRTVEDLVYAILSLLLLLDVRGSCRSTPVDDDIRSDWHLLRSIVMVGTIVTAALMNGAKQGEFIARKNDCAAASALFYY
jgi:hypothetical protein